MRNKVILIVALLLFYSVKSIAQIQNTFLGNLFGSTFHDVRNNLEQQGFVVYSSGNRDLSCHDIRFGGYEWSFCNFIFNNQSKFYKIRLSTPYTNSQNAVQVYEVLKENLQRKYKDCKSSLDEDDTDRYIDFFDEYNGITLFLSLYYGESKGGDYFYYVNLTYKDWSYDTSYDEL